MSHSSLMHFRRWGGLWLILLLVTACGDAAPAATATPPPPTPDRLAPLVAAARAEGTLTLIAVSRQWCNKGTIIETFSRRYGIAVTETLPKAGSQEELDQVQATKDTNRAAAPDVLDIGIAFGPSAKAAGLLQPYQVANWATIPAPLKDFDGYWYGHYYGVVVFEINADKVPNPPQEWADLLQPAYRSQIALSGDPTKSAQAISEVYAAALANKGTLDNSQPGLDFFAALQRQGNFVPRVAQRDLFLDGTTPIALRWDYHALAERDELQGQTRVLVTVPSKGVLAGVYAQAISAYAPHPNAAKLWMEWLYTDEAQLLALAGYCHPIRYNDLATRNILTGDLEAKLPPATIYQKALFPTVEQYTQARDLITSKWSSVVGVEVKTK